MAARAPVVTVTVSVIGYTMAREMPLEWRIMPDSRGLKVPCSTTELLAQALSRVYSKTTLSSTCGAHDCVIHKS